MRRRFLTLLVGHVFISLLSLCNRKKPEIKNPLERRNTATKIFRSLNGNPSENIKKVIELAGGIENIIGSDAIVVIKPNLQWWNQGAPNIAAFVTLVDIIMHRSGGFTGEVIVGENTHRGNRPWTTTAWAKPFALNSDLDGVNNFNQACERLKKKYSSRFSIQHWIDVSAGGKRVYGPKDGPGYVYCDGTGGVPLVSMSNGLDGKNRREVIMSYPIFETNRGTIVDFKNGEWSNGAYTGRELRFINLSALNHHSTYCGMTSSVKNYFGVTDISHGADPEKGGKLSGNYFNFHAFAFNEWAKGPVAGMMGKEIGVFMSRIRKADLNIVTAEWVGLVSRTDEPVVQTKAVLASTDPVALDYHSAKYALYPNSACKHHDPDWEQGPLYQYLSGCAQSSGYCIEESGTAIHSFDFSTASMQTEGDFSIYGKIIWGNTIKSLLKYLLFRFGYQLLN